MNRQVATKPMPIAGGLSAPLDIKEPAPLRTDRSPKELELAATGPVARLLASRELGAVRALFRLAGTATLTAHDSWTADTPWSEVVQIAWEEGAIVALRDALRGLTSGVVPLELERSVAVLVLERQLRMRILQRRASESVAALSRAGIEVALLKGAALSASVYDGFEVRPMNDVDLLVAPERADEAKRIMLASGWFHDATLPDDSFYQTHHHLAPIIDGGGSRCRLEIHRALLPIGHPFAIEEGMVWGAMRQVELDGVEACALDENFHALHIAIHFAWSHAMRAGAWNAFRDLGALTRRAEFDWDVLVEMAREARAATCCYWTLRLARSMTGLAVPDRVLDRLAPRLPHAALDRLEAHFVNVIARRDATQLSLWLDRALWSFAIQPTRQGHGGARPWTVSAELIAARRREDSSSRGERIVRQFSRVARCSTYLGGLLWK